jgi:hypothetical protein
VQDALDDDDYEDGAQFLMDNLENVKD